MNTYKGNSIIHWYQKAIAYGKVIMNCWKILGGEDGNTDLTEKIQQLVDQKTIPSDLDEQIISLILLEGEILCKKYNIKENNSIDWL